MKKAFEQDLLERINPSLKPSSPKAKTFLSTRNLDLQPSLSAQGTQGTSPKHPQTVRNLDLRTTISHENNPFSPQSREKVLSQRDILLKIPVDLYNKDQIYDAVHIFQNPRDKLKMIDLVLERRNQINDRKKRKKLAKAMTLLPEVTAPGSTPNKHQEPEPLNIVNRFRKTMVEIEGPVSPVFQEEEGIQPAIKGAKKKMPYARTQTAVKTHSEMSDSDSSDSSIDSVKLVFPIEDKGKNLRRRGSILQVRMSGATPVSMFKFGELNPIAENVATAGPVRKVSISELNLEKRKSLKQKDEQGGELAQQPILRRKSSFGLGLAVKSISNKEQGGGSDSNSPPILRRKNSLNQVMIKPIEEEAQEMPALLTRKKSMSTVGVQQQTQQQDGPESPPKLRRKSSVNLTLEAIVTGKASSSEPTTQEQQQSHLGTSSVLIHSPKKNANKSVSLAGATEMMKIIKSEPNDQAYSLAGKSLQRDLSRFLLTNKDHTVSELLLRHSPTMSPKLKRIQDHVKSQYQEITGFKPEKLPSLSSSPFKPALGSPRKLNQLLQRTSGDFAKDYGRKNRSIKQKSVSLVRMVDPAADQLQLTTDPSVEAAQQTKRVVVKKRQTCLELNTNTPKGDKKIFDRSPKAAKTVRGFTSMDYTGGGATWKDDFRRAVKVIN